VVATIKKWFFFTTCMKWEGEGDVATCDKSTAYKITIPCENYFLWTVSLLLVTQVVNCSFIVRKHASSFHLTLTA
jgi:hypothetical protein